jgi:hypothetical protein
MAGGRGALRLQSAGVAYDLGLLMDAAAGLYGGYQPRGRR